jgi:hypothetical protein
LLVRAATHADDVTDALKVVNAADDVLDAANAVDNALDAGNALKKPVVIGENMAGRVNPYAHSIGAETIDDWLAGRTWTQELNDQFIATVKEEGREVIDIGPDFDRRLRNGLDPTDPLGRPPSPIYGRERQQLLGYENYQRRYERFWKYGGGVPGWDY